MMGRLFFVVGPSGAGKDTLLAGAALSDPTLHWARRSITRSALAGGEPFESVTPAQFEAYLAQGEFALHWQAHDLHYGVRHSELAPRMVGKDVLLNGSRAAIAAARAAFPDLQVIVITARPEILAQRLAARGRETAADIQSRLERATFDLPPDITAHTVANNGSTQQGVAQLLQALKA
jgi:ribose 1,5-bisphosphokinase